MALSVHLTHIHPTIDMDGFAGYVTSKVANKVGDKSRNLSDIAQATRRNSAQHLLALIFG